MVEHTDTKKDGVIEIPVGKSIEKMRRNPWIFSTIILVVVLIVVIFMKAGITGNAAASVSGEEAGQNLIGFVNSQGQGTAEFVSAEKIGSLYKITVKYNGADVPTYVSLDGKYFLPSAVPLTDDAAAVIGTTDTTAGQGQQQPAATVPKSDKPKVELFVMSYCPYGTQMEKGILPVLALLKDKIDFKLEFTHFTLHGEKEDTEDFRQICIREEQPSKLLPYVQCILNSTDPYSPADTTQCMKSGGIDAAKVNTCISGKAKDYYAIDSGLSKGYGVQGSPTLVINGVQADSGRSPSAILTTICAAFNNAPAECSQSLPTESPSPGFGYSSSGSDAAAASCGV